MFSAVLQQEAVGVQILRAMRKQGHRQIRQVILGISTRKTKIFDLWKAAVRIFPK